MENADIAPGDNDPDKMRRENFIREGGPWTGSHGGSEGISGILFLIFFNFFNLIFENDQTPRIMPSQNGDVLTTDVN